MSLIALPLLLAAAAAAPAPKPPVAQQYVVATVQIVVAEEIDFNVSRAQAQNSGAKRSVKQNRTRDGMPLTEFY